MQLTLRKKRGDDGRHAPASANPGDPPMPDTSGAAAPPAAGLTIFRRSEAPPHRPGPPGGLSDVSREGLGRVVEAGLGDGAESAVLYDAPGFSLIYVWFKSGFPLYRHSHGPDCLYQVIGGSLQLGEAELRKGDGFFVPGGSAYSFVVGPDGVEILEFRHDHIHGTVIQANNPAFWDKAVETIRSRRAQWREEPRPTA
jgi:hypothetical protein